MLTIDEIRARANVLDAPVRFELLAAQIGIDSTALGLGPEGAPGGLHPFSPLAPSSNGGSA